MSAKTLAQWLDHAETAHPEVIELGLDRTSAVWEQLELPEPKSLITVAGTNGKGSCCAMAEAILSAAGYRVGCYTSPHFERFNERVRIDGEEASDAQLAEAFDLVEQARHKTPGQPQLTYFEHATLAAAVCFAKADVDATVMEVGMGGRLDAVNIFDPTVAILTVVGIDHTEYLGPDREAIGAEKAGIFREGRPAVVADLNPPQSVIDAAERVGAKLKLIGQDFTFSANRRQWNFRGERLTISGLPHLPLTGRHQILNAAAVVAALESAGDQIAICAGNVRQGLSAVRLCGRQQVLPGKPVRVLDVSHNPMAARELEKMLFHMGFFRETVAIFGIMSDKDIDGVTLSVAERVDHWLTVPLPSPRAVDPQILAARLAAQDRDAQACSSIGEAAARARELCDDDGRILVFGSFLTVAGYLREVDTEAR